MLMALIAPELLIWWALQQWIAARRLEKEFSKYGWSRTHGFFAVMGGFMMYEGNKPKRVILPRELATLVADGTIDFPTTTEDEIKDKSKGDALSKGLVMIQTTWFILQCIARGAERLPITELEVVTVAYAALNLLTYALWWNKPLNVDRPCRIDIKSISDNRRSQSEIDMQVYRDQDREEIRAEGNEEDGDELEMVIHGGMTHEMLEAPRKFGLVAAFKKLQVEIKTVYDEHGLVEVISQTLAGLSLIIFALPLILSHMVDEDWQKQWEEDNPFAMRVRTLYSGLSSADAARLAAGPAAAIATIFGAIHCVAWSFHFPSDGEQKWWRISSLLVTCIPFAVLLCLVLARKTAFGAAIWFGMFYPLPRYDLLVQAFIALRDLPEGAYKTVRWTTFLPHL